MVNNTPILTVMVNNTPISTKWTITWQIKQLNTYKYSVGWAVLLLHVSLIGFLAPKWRNL